MTDKIEWLKHSLIQHGKECNRIYLMKLAPQDQHHVIEPLERLAAENGYTKIIAKIPQTYVKPFEKSGYQHELSIPKFYNGRIDAVFMAKYFREERKAVKRLSEIQKVLAEAIRQSQKQSVAATRKPTAVELAGPEDAQMAAYIYKKVFKSYPFPIHDAAYIKKTMKSHIRYFIIRDGRRVVAMSSAEMDKKGQNAEMSDFATLSTHRRKGYANALLDEMEVRMRKEGMLTVYAMARALSQGMNVTFAKKNYSFAGSLANNSNINGRLETMNVWYKHL
jgi:beta-lysine N6-acetyltransferase